MAEWTKYLIFAASPLGFAVLVLVLVAFGVFGKKTLRRWVVALSCLQLLVFALPFTADQLMGHFEDQARQLAAEKPLPQGEVLDAIVVLGGGMESAHTGISTLPDLNDSSDRVWVGARLWKQGVARHMVFSGGGFRAAQTGTTEAQAMRVFVSDLGVLPEAVLLEEHSRTTLENARYTWDLLAKYQSPKPRIVLVTSAFHMPRAQRLFVNQGFDVFPVLSDVRVTYGPRRYWEELPNAGALQQSSLAIKEWLGLMQPRVASWFKVDVPLNVVHWSGRR